MRAGDQDMNPGSPVPDSGAPSAGAGSRPPLREPVQAAYVHVPFCVRKCAYCDFASYAGCLDQLPTYVAALEREIALAAAGTPPGLRSPLATVFLGGGTPSLLAPAEIGRILDSLSRGFGFTPDVEISVEANPGTLDQRRMAEYRQAGCNRISIGIQSLSPRLLATLGRIHSPDETVEALRAADAAGFARISADLMFGLPGQTLADVADTVTRVLARPVTHLSFYSLSLEPGTPFHQQYSQHPEGLPDDETERAQYAFLADAARAAGLRHYEISNAACPGEECRHNLVYWHAGPYHGFGAGAHGYVGGVRRGNVDTIPDYLERIAMADVPFAAAETAEPLTRADQEQEFMLLGLRLTDGVDVREYQSRFGGSLFDRFRAEIARLTERHLLERAGERLRLTRRGLDFANQAFMEFV